MVGKFGQVYLMDWGVARTLPAPGGEGIERRVEDSLQPASAELPSAITGTPSHMSPEQALGAIDQLTERSDVFLVGALLYHVVTRRPPYVGETVMAALVMAATGQRPAIDALPGGDQVPRELRRIIDRAMALEPEDRYPSIEALEEALVRFIRGVVDFPRVEVAAGEVIIREGDVGDAAYRIASGACRVTVGEGEAAQILREMGPGECFGETAILSPGPRTATVTAVVDTVLEVVTREELEAELSAMRPWMAAFIRTLADRFREREEAEGRARAAPTDGAEGRARAAPTNDDR
jgi:serine/threonine-protein kinase